MAVKRGNPPGLKNVRATLYNHLPTSTMVEVSHLADAGLLVEIAVIAAV
jgi:enamine deaminase RidA (YjgF/YER057c/UK114 family)